MTLPKQHTQIKVQTLSDLENYNLSAFPINGHMIIEEFPQKEDLEKCNIDPRQFVETFKYRSVYGLAAGITIIHVIDKDDTVFILGDHILHKAPWFITKLLYDTRDFDPREILIHLSETAAEERKGIVESLNTSQVEALLKRLEQYADDDEDLDDDDEDEEDYADEEDYDCDDDETYFCDDMDDEEYKKYRAMGPTERAEEIERRRKEWMEQQEQERVALEEKRRLHKEFLLKFDGILSATPYEEKLAIIAAGVKKGMDELRTQVCEMKFAKNMNYKEIGEALSISIPSARGIGIRFEQILREHFWKKLYGNKETVE